MVAGEREIFEAIKELPKERKKERKGKVPFLQTFHWSYMTLSLSLHLTNNIINQQQTTTTTTTIKMIVSPSLPPPSSFKYLKFLILFSLFLSFTSLHTPSNNYSITFILFF